MKLSEHCCREGRPIADSGAHGAAVAVQVQNLHGGWDVEHNGSRLLWGWPAVPGVAAEQARVVRREAEGVEMPAFVEADRPASL